MALQIITKAISESKQQDKIAHISTDDIARAGLSLETVLDELQLECEDSAESDGVYEFWGGDCDENTWRVRVG